MPLQRIQNNPFLVDLFPPFKKQAIAVYGTIAEIIAAVLILLVLFGKLPFTDPLTSIIVALGIFVGYSHSFHW